MRKLEFFILTLLTAVCCMVSMHAAGVSAVPTAADNPLLDNSKCDAKDQTQCVPDSNVTDATQKYCTANNCDLVAKYLNPFIKFLGILWGLAVTIGIIWGGIEYSSSAGDPQKSSRGKKHIVVAVISLFGYLFLYAAIHFLFPAGTTN